MKTEQMQTGNIVKPLRLGFLGMGWIGKNRLDALVKHGVARPAVISDVNMENAMAAAMDDTIVCDSMEKLLLESSSLDGVVIATPSALHAEQTIAALEAGLAVFCQKPLGRNNGEVSEIIETARRENRLLGIDLSYRFLKTVSIVEKQIRCGDIGRIFAIDAVFHNAYGPDKPWFYDPELSGGGCVIDLGVHLVDLVLWMFDFPSVTSIHSRLYANGMRISGRDKGVEDYAAATIELENGPLVNLACSWKLQAGTDAVIGLTFYGTEGALSIRNFPGSFYEFKAERYRGTSCEILYDSSDDWGGGAILDWAAKLLQGGLFDKSVMEVQKVTEVLDEIYKNS